MIELLIITLSLIFIFILGSFVCSFLNADYSENIILLFGISLSIGIFCIGSQMLLYNLLGFRWTAINIYSPWILIIILFVFLSKRRLPSFKFRSIRLDKLSTLLLFLILLLLLITLLESQMRPVNAWDAIATWYMGGKAFYADRFIDGSFYKYINYDAPPLIHLMVNFMSILIKNFNDTQTLLLFYAFYPALLTVFFFSLREKYSTNFSLFFTFLLASSQNFVRHAGRYDIGNADLPLSYFFFLSVFFVQKYNRKKTLGNITLAVITLTSSALVKNDGVPFALTGFLILLIISIKAKRKWLVAFAMLLITPLFYWNFFTLINHFPPSYLPFLNIHMDRMPGVAVCILKEMFNVLRWNFLWIFVLSSIVFIKKSKNNLIVF